jgi:DNA invertase Pin-like site-specific DNA recombinase
VSRLVCYLRVSTDEQAENGNGLAAQEHALLAWAAGRDVGWVVDPGVSGSVAPARRPALGPVLRGLRRGDALAVQKIDRLGRTVLACLTLADDLQRRGVTLIALDLQLDTSTAAGRAMLQMMLVFAEMERGINIERTRACYAVKMRDGWRPANRHSPEVEQRIYDLADAGQSQHAIARTMSEVMGQTLQRTQVQRILARRP